MAGIGFELKGLFKKKGLFAMFRAYGYAGIITTGPMILGILLLLGIMFLADYCGLPKHDQDLLVCMVTYVLLASLTCTSLVSMVTTRYIADMLYEERKEAVLPSFFGSCTLLLAGGGLLYGIFLCFAGIPVLYIFLDFILFCELIVVWMAMNYLTAIKNYRGILLSFAAAALASFLTGALLCLLFGPSVAALITGVCVGYGVMMTADVVLLLFYFPRGEVSCFYFLRWFDEYRPLAFTGFFTNLGLFAHLVLIWFSPIGEQVQGLFYGAPMHDVPALTAFLSILITTVNFVVSVEVNFYPKYRTYYGLFNEKGSIREIGEAEEEMLTVLENELLYTARKQLYMTALMLSVGLLLLEKLPLGFNDLMEGYFRILCIGYGIYAIANTIMLILLYFTDYRGAFAATACFAAAAAAGTLLSLLFDPVYYGFGFLAGSTVFFVIAWLRLRTFTEKLPYHILSTQPIVASARHGAFSRAAEILERKERKWYDHQETKTEA